MGKNPIKRVNSIFMRPDRLVVTITLWLQGFSTRRVGSR